MAAHLRDARRGLRAAADSWAEANHGLLSGILGAICVFAAFSGQTWLCDIVLLGMALAFGQRPPLWLWFIAVPVALTAPYASITYMPLWFAARILVLGSVWRGLRPDPRMLGVGAAFALVPQTLILWLVSPHWLYRVDGFTDNPTVLAEQGLALFTAFPLLAGWQLWLVLAESGSMLTASASRAALGAAGAFLALWLAHRRRLRWVLVPSALVGLVLLAVMVLRPGNPYVARFGPSGIIGTFDSRLDNLVGGSQSRANLLMMGGMPRGQADGRQADGSIFDSFPEFRIDGKPVPDFHKPHLSWLGYGYYSYVRKTGVQGPHNVPAQVTYDLGLLAVAIFGIAGWLLWSGRVRWQVAAVLLVLWMFSDAGWTTPGGIYGIAMMGTTLGAVFRRR